jgi:hypothetical protein
MILVLKVPPLQLPVAVIIHYSPSQIPAGVAETDLRLCKVINCAWASLPFSWVDTTTHTVTGLLTGFSTYGADAAVTGDITQIAMGTAGKDRITQYGGTGTDTLTVNSNGLPVRIQNGSLQTIYQRGTETTITVENVEHITVFDADGTTILFQN